MAKICIDAGHYGKVNRSPVVPEYYESDMTWKLHLLLKTELEKRGISVITTRLSQIQDLELTARGRKAAGCDLFLSLHSNAVETESVDRPVGIYLIPDDTTTADEKKQGNCRSPCQNSAQRNGNHSDGADHGQSWERPKR